MTKTKTIPEGFWENAKGSLVPETKVKPIDKLRDQFVREWCAKAKAQSEQLKAFKGRSMGDFLAFVETSVEQYEVKVRGSKGNVTLFAFDASLKIVYQVQDRLIFGEQLQAAKALIDQCVRRWAEGANDNIRVLVNDAFQVDKAGKINTARVLGLKRLDITDPEWKRAMQAITDSTAVADSKPYIRFYERDEQGVYQPIVLDLAAL